MVRDKYKTRTPLSKKLMGYALINILPIGGLAWFAWALSRGDVSLDDLPKGLDRNAAYLGCTIALLFVLVTFLLPFVHWSTSRLKEGLLWAAEVRSHAGFFRLILELVLWPFRLIFHGAFWILRLALFLSSFALIALSIVFIVRFFHGDFMEDLTHLSEWMARGEDWLKSL